MKLLKKKKFHLSITDPVLDSHSRIRERITWLSSSSNKKELIKNLDINHLKNIIAKIERGDLDERMWQLFDLKNELIYRNLSTKL